MQRRALGIEPAQAAGDLGGKNLGQGCEVIGGHRDVQRHGGVSRSGDAVNQRISRHAQVLRRDDLYGKAAHVFDQNAAQGDRDGPNLADHQRGHALIGLHKPAQDQPRNQAVGMRHIRPGKPEYPGISCQMPVRKLGQLAIIARRQIFGDLAQLQFDQMEIVQQPFRRRGDGLTLLHHRSAGVIGIQQDADIVLQPPGQRRNTQRQRCNGLRRRQRFRVMFQSLCAEQVRPDWCCILPCGRDLQPGQAIARVSELRSSATPSGAAAEPLSVP